jgi:hypothetical protein
VRNVGYKAVRPARGRPPAPGAPEVADEFEDVDAYADAPEALTDPLHSQ